MCMVGFHEINKLIMRLYKRKDFIKLPAMTIYSRVDNAIYDICDGLFCKTSGEEYSNDWVEQDLISSVGFPNNITNGGDALVYQMNLRDNFRDFITDLDCAGRDGVYDDKETFVVWDKEDVTKLRDYLSEVLGEK